MIKGRKYSIIYDDIVKDLSDNNFINMNTPPINVGKNVCLTDDGKTLFIGMNKSYFPTSNNLNGVVNGVNHNGDVFVFYYNDNDGTWNIDLSSSSLYEQIHVDISNHEYNSGTQPMLLGSSIHVSRDMNKLFIGIPNYRIGNISKGAISIFNKVSNKWVYDNTIVQSNNIINKFGSSIATSYNGDVLFIGTNTNNASNSYVYKYNYNSLTNEYNIDNSFTTNIKSLCDLSNNSNFGNSIVCNDTGDILVIGSSNYFNTSNSTYTGNIQIIKHDYNQSEWILLKDLKEDISNNKLGIISNGSNIGRHVTMDASGNKIIFNHDSGYNVNNSLKYGYLFYFEYDDISNNYYFNSHIKADNTIFTTSNSRYFGTDVKISSNGNYLLTSIKNKNIYLYCYDNSSNNWVKETDISNQNIYQDISNNTTLDIIADSFSSFGQSLSINYDGKYISVGSNDYKYNKNTTGSTNIIGHGMILYGKETHTIHDFDDLEIAYNVEYILQATTDDLTIPLYIDIHPTNKVYNLTSLNKIKIIGLGDLSLQVKFIESSDYVETLKTINIHGKQAAQHIEYTAAIDTQQILGISQRSGIIFDVYNSDSNTISPLSVTMDISGSSVVFDPIYNEFEAISYGITTVTLFQVGDLNHAPVVPIVLQYDVSSVINSPWMTSHPNYMPLENGIEFTNTGIDESILSTINAIPYVNNIKQLVGINNDVFYEKIENDGKTKIFSIPVSHDGIRHNISRTMMKRTDNPNQFSFEIKDLSNNSDVKYMSISLKDKNELYKYTNMSMNDKSVISSIENATDIFQIESYSSDDNETYTKMNNIYHVIRVYHPYDTLVIFHIDDNDVVKEVNTDNYANSMITRDIQDPSYWYVKMPFSSGIGGTSSTTTTTNSSICFLSNTYIETDQGEIKITKLNKHYHTIRGNKIIGVTKINNPLGKILRIRKDTFKRDVPNRDLYVSMDHKMNYMGKMMKVKDLANIYNMDVINSHDVLYNILMEKYDYMKVHNCIMETLDPRHPIAHMHKKVIWNEKMNKKIKQQHIENYNILYKKDKQNLNKKMK